jgi:hypothetical protein
MPSLIVISNWRGGGGASSRVMREGSWVVVLGTARWFAEVLESRASVKTTREAREYMMARLSMQLLGWMMCKIIRKKEFRGGRTGECALLL